MAPKRKLNHVDLSRRKEPRLDEELGTVKIVDDDGGLHLVVKTAQSAEPEVGD